MLLSRHDDKNRVTILPRGEQNLVNLSRSMSLNYVNLFFFAAYGRHFLLLEKKREVWKCPKAVHDYQLILSTNAHPMPWRLVQSEEQGRVHEKMGIRDFSVTKKWAFVTFTSWKMRISWRSCHKKWGFHDVHVMKQNSSSHETVLCRDIPVTKLEPLMEFNEKPLFFFIKYVVGDQWLLQIWK